MISNNRLPRIIIVITLFVLFLILGFFIVQRVLSADDFGDPFVLCPGPDFYGYVCARDTAFSYIDASEDTQLYALDGVTEIALPFPFTFYGTTYTSLFASVNGNVQFGSGNELYANSCLVDGSTKEMGEMIAPYWDDLDLRATGFLETAVSGTEPNRIFVIEWDDVPRFGNDEDRVTFEIQLFEANNDIVFLYEDVTTFEGNNGSSATIGLQSAGNNIALQLGCNQPVVANASQIQFPHPAKANGAVDDLETAVSSNSSTPQQVKSTFTPRSATAQWLQQINLLGATTQLPALRQDWLAQTPAYRSDWTAADLSGDTLDELIITRYGTDPANYLAELIVLSQESPTAAYTIQLQAWLSDRTQPLPTLTIFAVLDVTADDLDDVILYDQISGTVFVLTAVSGNTELLPLNDGCNGNITLKDSDENGRVELIRNGCPEQPRLYLEWDGTQFQPKS